MGLPTNLVRLVLDPPGPRKVLGKLAVGPPERAELAVEEDGGHAGGAGVDR